MIDNKKQICKQQSFRGMKSVLQFLQMDHKHMEHELCHPRRQATFDNDAIQKKIDQIRNKKQQLRVEAQRKKIQLKSKQKRFDQFPLEQILQQSLEPLQQSMSMLVKQKMKFIEQKVYIGTKNNINSEYISKVIDSNEAKPALKYQLSLFMEDIVGQVEGSIMEGQFQIFNKKDVIVPKSQQNGTGEPNASKLIQIKKVELSQKIQQLKDELIKTELQQEKLSPIPQKRKSFSIRSASASGSMITQSLNIDEFSIKSARTKEAEEFVKKLQKQQEQQRKLRKKREQQLKEMQVKSEQEKKQFEEHMKKQRHEKLKKRFEEDRKEKMAQFEKSSKAKADFQKFLSEYKRRLPLYKEKQIKFKKETEKAEKEKAMTVLSEIKETKRSIDINELKEHQNKYKVVKEEFEKEKLANLKHRQKEIALRHKQDKLYFRGRYHSMIKEQEQKQPEDPTVKRDDLLKRKKEYGEKVKKEFVPLKDPVKQKELEDLISQVSRNKPKLQSKDYNELGNKYLADLHKFIREMKQTGKIKVELPQQIKPRYKNYLNELKKQRNYQTISFDRVDPDSLQKQALKLQQNAKRREKILSLRQDIDIAKQLKEIDELDMELLKSAQIKAKLVEKYDPRNDDDDED